MDNNRVTRRITLKPDLFMTWIIQASRSEKLEAGYLLAQTMDRSGLAALRDYTNGRIDALDSLEPKE